VFDTHDTVFRTGLSIPTGNCTRLVAIEGANGFYDACVSNPVCARPKQLVIKAPGMRTRHATVRTG